METKFIEQLSEIFEVSSDGILLSDKFRDYEKWDSITSLSLIAMIESEFGVLINTKSFNKLVTVEDLLNEIRSNAG